MSSIQVVRFFLFSNCFRVCDSRLKKDKSRYVFFRKKINIVNTKHENSDYTLICIPPIIFPCSHHLSCYPCTSESEKSSTNIGKQQWFASAFVDSRIFFVFFTLKNRPAIGRRPLCVHTPAVAGHNARGPGTQYIYNDDTNNNVTYGDGVFSVLFSPNKT